MKSINFPKKPEDCVGFTPDEAYSKLVENLLENNKDWNKIRLMFRGKQITSSEELWIAIAQSNERHPINLLPSLANKVGTVSQNVLPQVTKTSPVIPKTETLSDLLKSTVTTFKNMVATVGSNSILTHKKLNNRANQLGHHLVNEYDIKPGSRIAIMGFNQAETVIAMLAALKIGAPFVIFDPTTPSEKLSEYFKAADIACLVTNESIKVPFNSSKVVNLKEQEQDIIKQSSKDLETKIDDSELAYLLFTSGSTSATPKIVMQTRQGLMGQMQNHAKDLNIRVNDNLLQISNIAHDQALCTMFAALLKGAGLYFYDMKNLDPIHLRNYINQRDITVFTSIPSVFSTVFEDADPYYKAKSLRLIRLGGEAVKMDHLELYNRIANDKCSFGVGYGATECSWMAYFETTKDQAQEIIKQGEMPLGKMSGHITPYVDSPENNGKGELCIASPHLSLGYQNNDEAQKAAFFTLNNAQYYRTGDIVELKDGAYLFRGRKNWHVKINGERVSLKEVEDTLRQHFPMQECAVIPYGKEDNLRLFAFYTAKKEANIDEHSIRRDIAPHLKPIMIPFGFFQLDTMPKLANQKLNRTELDSILSKKLEVHDTINEESDVVDKALYQVLGNSYFKGDESLSFYELGINSLQISRLYSVINQQLSKSNIPINVSIQDLYSAGSIQKLKELISNKIHHKDMVTKKKGLNVTLYQAHRPDILYMNSTIGVKQITFEELSLLADHFTQVSGIKMVACGDRAAFKSIVDDFINNPELEQMGLILPSLEYSKDSHQMPLLLKREKDGIHAYIADGIGILNGNARDICEHLNFKNISIHFDPSGRLGFCEACAVEAFHWLSKALLLGEKFNENIIPLDGWTPAEYEKGLNAKYFLSAPDQLVASQRDGFEEKLPIKLNLNEIKLGLSDETIAQHRKTYEKTDTFYIVTPNPDFPDITEITYNDYLHQLSFHLKDLAASLKK